jgi:hypothetical protein
MPRIVKELRHNLNGGVINDYLSIWSDYDQILRTHIIKGKIDGEFDLNSSTLEALSQQGSVATHPVSVDKDGDYIIHTGSKQNLLAWSPNESLKDQAKPIMSRVAAAFAIEDRDTLGVIQRYIETINWDDPMLDKMEQLARQELKRMSRVAVRGVLSNSGKSPISISGSGNMKIFCEDFSYRTSEQPNSRKLQSNITLPMQFINEEYIQPIPSISIPGGGVVPFTAISPFYLFEIDKETRDDIIHLYGSDRAFELSFPRLDQNSHLTSVKSKFRREDIKNSITDQRTKILDQKLLSGSNN